MQWDNSGAEIHLEQLEGSSVDIPAIEAQIEGCLTEHRYEDQIDPFVDPYERARLYEYYTAVTIPCLARRGDRRQARCRSPSSRNRQGGEPWNPYLGMEQPFDRLLELYGPAHRVRNR